MLPHRREFDQARRVPASARLPRTARPLHRRLLALGAATLLVVGCGSTTATPTPTATAPAATPSATLAPASSVPSPASAGPSEDVSAVYDQIESQVIQIRGLKPKTPVTPTVLDDAGIKKLTAEGFTKDNPPALIAANERVMKALGLLPADASLKDLYVSMLGSQVAGLYNPDDKKLYVVSRSGAIGPVEKTTFSHEFTHALQDQNFDLGALKLDEVGQGDRSFARLALVEGDATLTMSYWQIQGLSQAELGQLLSQSLNDPSTKELMAMPAILRESLMFPYVQGLAFVQGLQTSSGWAAVNDAFAKPPASSEQILHPDKYAAGETPIATELPKDLASRLGTGWTIPLEDSFGEFQLGIWLRELGGGAGGSATTAAAGWGGDRVAVANGPNGAWTVVLRTTWDSANDAAEFEAAAGPAVSHLANPAALLPGAGGTERWVVVASDDATLSRTTNVLGLAG